MAKNEQNLNYEQIVAKLHALEKSAGGRMQLLTLGESGEGRTLYAVKIGSGDKRIWIQGRLHGHEPIGGDAIMRYLEDLASGSPEAERCLAAATFLIIPIYNPDGSEAFKQNDIVHDQNLGRDFNLSFDVWKKQKEMGTAKPYPFYKRMICKETRAYYDAWLEFKPHFIVDLHQMRTPFLGESKTDLMHFCSGIPIRKEHLTKEQWDASRQLAVVLAQAADALDFCNAGIYEDVDDASACDACMLLGSPGPGYPGITWEKEWLECVLALDADQPCSKVSTLAEIPSPTEEMAAKDGFILDPGWRNLAGNFMETSMCNEKAHPQLQNFEQQVTQNIVALRAYVNAVISGSYRDIDPDRYADFPRNGIELKDT